MQKDIFDRLAKSKFRSRFKLTFKDKEYVRQKGMPEIRRHAEDFIARRLARPLLKMTANRHLCAIIRFLSRNMLPAAAAGNVWANGTIFPPALP